MTEQSHKVPLVVDLDGTLIRTDVLYESVIGLVARNPLYIVSMVFWLLRGKAAFKREVARRLVPDPTSLPYHAELLDYLHDQKTNGRRLVLATASDEGPARQIAAHLGLFDEVHASDGVTNLSATAKRDRLVQRYGERGFDYAGNALADVAIWRSARQAIAVNTGKGVRRRLSDVTGVDYLDNASVARWQLLVKALRPHQWAKNLLVFVPLIAGHQVGVSEKLLDSVVLFLAFSLCASAVYLINDLVDLEADRHHERKRKRPFASGDLSVAYGAVMAPVLVLAGLLSALTISLPTLGVLVGYLALTSVYSLYLKKIMLVDVIVLAGLYTIRILAGVVAVDQMLSFWLLAFSIFLFTSLAMLKRHTELVGVRRAGGTTSKGRGYQADDIEMLVPLGVAAGYMAVLVFALYINSGNVLQLYAHPQWLWLVCPVLLYWISRAWMLSHRGEMHDDPIVFALKDKASLATVTVVVALMVLAL